MHRLALTVTLFISSALLSAQETGSIAGRVLAPDGTAEGYVVSTQTGTVPEAGADPATWADAYARGADAAYRETRVSDDGAFALADLPEGTYALDLRRPGEREAWCSVAGIEVKPGETTDIDGVVVPDVGWRYLLDRESLDGWTESEFYGQREVETADQAVTLTMGEDMTGITFAGEVPKADYELTLQAMRADGDDFFCGLTFPLGESHCSLILGGWGGSTVGLSSIDGADASMNETTQWIDFDEKRWYRVRIRVADRRISVWLDGEEIIDVDVADRRVDTRIEMEHSKPLGIATWRTSGAARDIRLRALTDDERLPAAGGE